MRNAKLLVIPLSQFSKLLRNYLLLRLHYVPDDFTIQSFDFDFKRDSIVILAKSKEYPVVKEGAEPESEIIF